MVFEEIQKRGAEEERCLDLLFIAELVVRVVASRGFEDTIAGRLGTTSWFPEEEDEQIQDLEIDVPVDDSFGTRRMEAARFLGAVHDRRVRDLISEFIGTALMLQMGGRHPNPSLDLLFLAQATHKAVERLISEMRHGGEKG